MIGLVTDSNAQLPPALVQRYGVVVVPLTVTVAGVAYLEGEDLDADTFYDLLERANPAVSTSQPSPGRIAAAYRALADRGAREILSVHADHRVSGTVNAARLAADGSPVPVRVVETNTASFGVACCVREAAEALGDGATPEEAEARARQVGGVVGNVFVVGALDLARAGGRLAEGPPGDTGAADGGIPVLSLTDGTMQVVGRAADVEEAAEVMARRVGGALPDAAAGSSGRLRVGVGLADRAATPLRDALERRLTGVTAVDDLVRYRVGPSVGAHTGRGTVGAVFYPSPTSEA